MISTQSRHDSEVRAGQRFEFGRNWTRFLAHISERRIADAVASLQKMLGRQTLSGLTFLDAGCGSGLFSLAARRLGAIVHSFDFDPQSCACSRQLKQRYAPGDAQWRIEEGSVLDPDYVAGLGKFDIVYSWGVLHHTGNQALGLRNVMSAVKPGGTLFIALYNDQGWISHYWSAVKRWYNASRLARPLLVIFHAPYLVGARWLVRALNGRLRAERGMTLWYDMIDWLGGWPFEVSRAEQITSLAAAHGFSVYTLRTVKRRAGCNEFVFTQLPHPR
jgi:2-polyprenyl-3-methyl-5-hydroxy-6-metoxy-1,4-benzoquinol methylase